MALEGAEARHMVKVLRTRPGEIVRLFDGVGREGDFEVLETSKSHAVLKALELKDHGTSDGGVWLALGWNKSSRRSYLLEKAVELQAGGIVFWQAEFSQGKVPGDAKESWLEKAVQAAKQCGSAWLPEFDVVSGGVQGVAEYGKGFDRTIIAWENEQGALLSPAELARGRTLIVIGPEGGFADHEAEAFMHKGFSAVSLGSSVLRWETAAMHCLSLSFYAREALKS
ncbi:RsmE family RNA methyltransferase [Salidesulfovibrio onnuriiensis]|uniref:RsmE family RNA methyltransferase n=1 Tax=Salidesulfovibrio onnuriiensis TaxID=2583823 RepID=UPI0032B83628